MPNVLTPRAAAMNFLAAREHSAQELTQKLLKKGFSLEEIQQALVRLQQQNLQSDARFSEMYVRHRAQQGFGPIRIRQELQQRGIAEVLTKAALTQFTDQEWQEMAELAYAKRFKPQAETAQTKKTLLAQWRFLLYRGFEAAFIRKILPKNSF